MSENKMNKNEIHLFVVDWIDPEPGSKFSMGQIPLTLDIKSAIDFDTYNTEVMFSDGIDKGLFLLECELDTLRYYKFALVVMKDQNLCLCRWYPTKEYSYTNEIWEMWYEFNVLRNPTESVVIEEIEEIKRFLTQEDFETVLNKIQVLMKNYHSLEKQKLQIS